MEIEQLQCFVEVCKSRSFTVAANVLYLSQPTISKKIQSLENEMGVELICRKKNFAAPTPAGRYLLEEAQKIIMLADDVLQQTKRIGSGKVGAIHIGISDQLDFNGILPGFLKEFSDEEPMIDVCLSVYPYTEIPGMVAHGEIDAGFLPNVVHRPQFDGQTCIHINRTCPHLYFSSQHKMANRPNVSVEDFLNTPLYLVGGADSETMNKLRHANLCFQQVIFVESMQVLKLYLEANLGVTVLGVSQCVGSSDRICSIPLPEMDFSVGTDCIYNANDGNSSVPVFISSLKSYLKI